MTVLLSVSSLKFKKRKKKSKTLTKHSDIKQKHIVLTLSNELISCSVFSKLTFQSAFMFHIFKIFGCQNSLPLFPPVTYLNVFVAHSLK